MQNADEVLVTGCRGLSVGPYRRKEMAKFTRSVEIAAPVEDVFEFDSNPENWTKTTSGLRDLEIVDETGGDGRPVVRHRDEPTMVEPNEQYRVTVEGDEVAG